MEEIQASDRIEKAPIDRHAAIVTTSAIIPHRIRQKIVDKPSWYKSEDGHGWMTIDLSAPPNFLGFAQLCPDPSERLTPAQLASRQAYFNQLYKKMNDVTIDIFDIICANWIENKNVAGFARIYAKDILELRGFAKTKKGTFDTSAKRDVADHISILNNLWVTVNEAPIYEDVDGKRQKSKFRTHSRLILVGSYQDQQLETDVTPYSWSVMPGEAIQPFFSDPNKQFMLMIKRVLAYHPLKQSMEKRIARHLIWHFRVRQAKGDYLRSFNNQKLLTEACIKIDRRHPLRYRDRLEEAFNRLEDDGIISGWQYAEGWGRENIQKNGWVDDWLGLNIIFEPAAEVLQFNSAIEKKYIAPQLVLDPKALVEQLRSYQEQNRKEISQLKLAETLEITPAYLSMMFSGARKPSKKLSKKISALLQTARKTIDS